MLLSVETILVFLGVCMIAYITPGPDWFVVMRHSASTRRSGFVSALGVQAGLSVHMVAAAVGVTAVVLASATAFSILKYAGAAYLIFLGAQSLWRSRKTAQQVREYFDEEEPRESTGDVFWKSFTANVLNPQAAMFFVAVLPQFISPGQNVVAQILLLGVLDILLGVVWWIGFVYGVVMFKKMLGHARFRTLIDRISGSLLIVFGAVLMFLDPPESSTQRQRLRGPVYV
ncbi:LysE family translocator [Nesterenkonia ebinurensis]|uniref:LysE family translocator n=1 Tax=Nesterenkonia ebinurensis TaxID=2608252 RepID=UPI00123DE796|nr:LysE family translocator [Nesterenkonia ebinurensis]